MTCSSAQGTSRNFLSLSLCHLLTEPPWERSLTYDIHAQAKTKSLLTIPTYQQLSHNSPEMQSLLCRDQAWRNQADRILEVHQHIRTSRERSYNSQRFYHLHIWQKPALKKTNKQTNKQFFEEFFILAVTLVSAPTGFKPDAFEGSLESDQV